MLIAVRTQASNGATTARVGKTFKNRYIEAAKEAGTFRYISPDRQIDASTALFHDRTWFIKNLKHDEFSISVDLLFGEMIRNDGYTISSDPDYPKYMVFCKEDGGITPLTEESSETESWSGVTFLDALKMLFLAINELLLQAIREKTASPEA